MIIICVLAPRDRVITVEKCQNGKNMYGNAKRKSSDVHYNDFYYGMMSQKKNNHSKIDGMAEKTWKIRA